MIPPRISPTQLGTRFGTLNFGHMKGSQSFLGRHVNLCWHTATHLPEVQTGAGQRYELGANSPVRAAMEHAIRYVAA